MAGFKLTNTGFKQPAFKAQLIPGRNENNIPADSLFWGK